MKKILFAGVVVFGSMSMVACDRTGDGGTTEQEGVVVDRDSVATEYEVTETVVEYDTTKRTRTVEADPENDRN